MPPDTEPHRGSPRCRAGETLVLSAHALSDDDGRQLLRDATDAEPAELDRLLTQVLPSLTILGAHDTVSGRLLGMIAYEVSSGRDGLGASCGVVVEYLAVARAARGTGLGSRLVDAVADRHPGLAVEARTDDDAVDFYRAAGFAVEAAPRDPRWPDRDRYVCRRPGWRETARAPVPETVDHTLEALDAISPAPTHDDAARLLLDAGWRSCGAGDWAVALAAPDCDLVARISPFDPVGPYTAWLYREAASTGLVPTLFAHRRLAGGGDLQLMERLEPTRAAEAEELLARVGEAAHEGGSAPEPATPELAGLAALARTVRRVHRTALRDLPWCGPLDTNPSNVMRTPAGRLVLTDPYYADGPNLYATAERDPDLVVAMIPEDQRRYLTQIPLTCSGPWKPGEAEALREKLRQADERRQGAGGSSSAAGPTSLAPRRP